MLLGERGVSEALLRPSARRELCSSYIAKEKYVTQRIGDFEICAEELQPIRFQGQSFDVETGLHYNRFRYYDPDVGMFISRDPIGLMGGDNVFAYAPNPTGWIDPLGLVTLDEAEQSLQNINVPHTRFIKTGKILVRRTYKDIDIFNEWLRLEKQDTSWLNEIRKDRRCPQNMSRCTGPMWEEVDEGSIGRAKVWWFHRGATF